MEQIRIGSAAHRQKVWDEKKKSLDARIEGLKKKIGGLGADNGGAAVADELIDAVRFREGQPYEVAVPLEDVIKEYDFGSYHISRCRNCFVWKTAGYRAVIEPMYNYDLSNGGGALYSVLTELCDIADKKDAGTATEDESTSYDLSLMMLSVAFSLPVMMFSDAEFAVNVYKHILDELQAMLERTQSRLNEETPEDIAKNQMFEQMMREAEAAKTKAEEESGKE